MAKCIAIVNQKGGVGKTTTSVNLAASLAFYGQKILLLDLDPQANATSGLGFDKRSIEKTIYHVLSGSQTILETIQKTAIQNLDIIPSHIDLIGAEIELIQSIGREQILKTSLQQLASSYDFIFMDCPPSLGLLTLNALCAAQAVLIPIQCEYYAMEGLSQLMDTIQRVQKILNPQLQIEGVLMTMFDSRIKLSNDVVNEIRKVFGEKVYQSLIVRNVRLAESPSFGKPIFVYDFASRGSQAYLQLAKEFMQRNGIVDTSTNNSNLITESASTETVTVSQS